MKTYIKLLVVLAAISFTQLVVAREELLEATIKNIKVTSIVPEVRERLKKASSDERKSLEAAVRTGNLFIPQYFSYNAYDSDPENKDWVEETAPLIAVGREEWMQHYQWLDMNRKETQLESGGGHTTRLTCPHIALVAVQQENDATTLVYRTHSMGTLINYQGDLYAFNAEGAGYVYEIRIDLDNNARVNKVVPPDQWVTWSYTKPIAYMKRFLGDHSVTNISTKEREDEMVRTYQSTIQKIEKSAAMICK